MSAKRKPTTSAEPSTKKVKFEWVDVQDDQCPPYLVNFNTTPDVEFLDNDSPNTLKFQVTTRGSSDKTSLTALRKNMVYHGEPNDAETSYYVGVYNKKTSTLKFVPTSGIVNIKQTFTKKTPNTDSGLLPLTPAQRHEKLIKAVTQFGSKNSIVAKKAKREKEFKLSAEDLDQKTLKKMTNTISEKKKQEVAPEAPYDIPPPNMSATSVDQVYTLMTDLEKQLLPLEEVREFMKTSKVLAPWVDQYGLDKSFFDALNKTKIKEMKDDELATRLYLMYFAGFLKNLAEEVKGKEGNAVIPKPLQTDLFTKFVDRKSLYKNKVINYLCVFYLTLNDYIVNVTKMHEQISDFVRVDLRQLEKHFKLIGAVVRKPKETEDQACRYAELRLPLKFSWK